MLNSRFEGGELEDLIENLNKAIQVRGRLSNSRIPTYAWEGT